MKYCAVTLDMMMGLVVVTQLPEAVFDSMAAPATAAEARMVSMPVDCDCGDEGSRRENESFGSLLLKRNMQLMF